MPLLHLVFLCPFFVRDKERAKENARARVLPQAALNPMARAHLAQISIANPEFILKKLREAAGAFRWVPPLERTF
jgi:hypothetical protein